MEAWAAVIDRTEKMTKLRMAPSITRSNSGCDRPRSFNHKGMCRPRGTFDKSGPGVSVMPTFPSPARACSPSDRSDLLTVMGKLRCGSAVACVGCNDLIAELAALHPAHRPEVHQGSPGAVARVVLRATISPGMMTHRCLA